MSVEHLPAAADPHASDVRAIAGFVDTVEALIAAWAAEVGAGLTALTSKPTGTAIDKLVRPTVEEWMGAADPVAAGAGFVANAGLLGPDRSYIAWWQGADLERVDALANFSPSSMSRYVGAEWFRFPVATGLPHVTGPYVDFLCTDEYVCTFTHPVTVRGLETIAGVVGADVTVQSFERRTLAALRRIGPTAALVNQDGRAIAASALGASAGDLMVRDPGAAAYDAGRSFHIWTAASAQDA